MAISPPTSSLPPLSRLPSCSLKQVAEAVENLRSIYCPQALTTLPKPKALPKHLVHDTTVPDSGYASEDGDDEPDDDECDANSAYDADVLRADSFERDFAIRWLTGFTARADMWAYSEGCSEDESEARAALVDAAASMLATFAGHDEDEDITRTFTFPTGRTLPSGEPEVVNVELNDAPLISDDHTSVGLQSWGSAIRFAERMALDPSAFGLTLPSSGTLRVLELGAGTGLLGIVAAKLLALSAPSPSTLELVATDFHPSVLDNLRRNVATNFPAPESSPVDVRALDWERPAYAGALAAPFDVVLAADVIYHPDHARWIKTCAAPLLAPGGVFWLIMALRPTGRHEGMSDTVDTVFGRAEKDTAGAEKELAILEVEDIQKQAGVGRVDEGGYKLYKIGWV